VAGNEGKLLIRRHVARERDPRLRRRKIVAVLSHGGSLACEACGFDFEETYGERGHGYMCHHVIPLHVTGPGTTRLSDLALLCANCHRITHARPPWLTPQELRSLVASRSHTLPPKRSSPACRRDYSDCSRSRHVGRSSPVSLDLCPAARPFEEVFVGMDTI